MSHLVRTQLQDRKAQDRSEKKNIFSTLKNITEYHNACGVIKCQIGNEEGGWWKL